MAGQLILSLTILVAVHEAGHFFFAKLFGMRVDKFFIFFDWGGKIWSKKIRETEYGIGLIPLGGYVKIAGMIDESMDTEQMKREPEPWEFRSKPAWQRFLVMVGGILFNIALGAMIFAGWFMTYEKSFLPAEVAATQGVYATPFAEEFGFQTGDKILTLNGEMPERFKDFNGMGVYFGSTWEIERNGQPMTIELPDTLFQRAKGQQLFLPMKHLVKIGAVLENSAADEAGLDGQTAILAVNDQPVDNFGQLSTTLKQNSGQTVGLTIDKSGQKQTVDVAVSDEGTIGFYPTFDYKGVNPTTPYNLGNSLYYGLLEGWRVTYFNAVGFGLIFAGKVSAADAVQSPIGIAKVFGGQWNWSRFWWLTALISFVLAFMNLLPIPALDGGHMLFIGIEMLRGKPLSDKFLERAQLVGMAILFPLMLLVVGKDIWQAVMSLFG